MKYPKEIWHISAVRRLTIGQQKQLCAEFNNGDVYGVSWKVVAIVSEPQGFPYEVVAPFGMKGFFGRNLYKWIWIWKKSSRDRLFLVRYTPLDPFAFLFGRLIKNWVSVHHSIEANYLPYIRPGLIGQSLGRLEKIIGRQSISGASAVFGVCDSVLKYQIEGVKRKKNAYLMANGVDYENIVVAGDNRKNEFKFILVAGKFRRWKGLPEVLDAIEVSARTDFQVFIVGEVPLELIERINNCSFLRSCVTVCGVLKSRELNALYSFCDAGLGSFGFESVGMEDGSTFKVGEYLAAGIPVISGHRDSRLPEDFLFYHRSGKDIADWIAMAKTWRGYSRQEVSIAAREYLNKKDIMKGVIKFLSWSRLIVADVDSEAEY